MSAASRTVGAARSSGGRRSPWARATAGRSACSGSSSCSCSFTKLIQPSYGAAGLQGLAISVLPLALAAVAQAIVVISGGIDLSVGSMMALTSVVAAVLMEGQSEAFGVGAVIGVLLLGIVLGAINGSLVVVTRVPDIVVTLAMALRLGGLRAARAGDAGRRRGAVAQGSRSTGRWAARGSPRRPSC